MNNHFTFAFLVVILLTFKHDLKAQITIDTSAIAVFWEVADTLSADKIPSGQLWAKFSNHPAYAQIQKSGNRVTFLKRILPLVFRPSQSEKLQETLAGPESFQQYFAQHLQEVKLKRQELNVYLKSNQLSEYKEAYQLSLQYLPEDLKDELPEMMIYIALFEDNGFGGKVITMDLLHLLKGTPLENRHFFGHEFHHALRNQSKTYTLYDPDSSAFYPIIEALNKMPLEGVASMIDKSKYFNEAYYSNTDAMSVTQQETVAEFQQLVKGAPTNLQRIDSILTTDLPEVEKGKMIFQQLPWSGHAIGFYMARAIDKALGREKLIATQYSCIDFVLIYQEAAKMEEGLYQFSEKAIGFLRGLR